MPSSYGAFALFETRRNDLSCLQPPVDVNRRIRKGMLARTPHMRISETVSGRFIRHL